MIRYEGFRKTYRPGARRRRARPGGPAGRDAGADRTERLRQEHHPQGGGGAGAAERGAGPRGRSGCRARSGGAARGSGISRSGSRSPKESRRATRCDSMPGSVAPTSGTWTRCLERVGLADAAGRATDGFSGGMRQRLGIAVALLGRPRSAVARRAQRCARSDRRAARPRPDRRDRGRGHDRAALVARPCGGRRLADRVAIFARRPHDRARHDPRVGSQGEERAGSSRCTGASPRGLPPCGRRGSHDARLGSMRCGPSPRPNAVPRSRAA